MYPTKNSLIGLCGVLVSIAWLGGCPTRIPQPELDAAQQAFEDIENTKDCAPEKYLSARASMDRAQALIKEERFEEAKTALLAAQKLAQEARDECDRKAKEASQAKIEPDPQPVARTTDVVSEGQGPQKMETIYFEFNASSLSDESRQSLSDNAEYIRNRASLRVQLEGHCDEKGSTEYNLALGERRAMAVKQYLVKMGISTQRLQIISFGEERLLSEDDAKNRRVEFLETP